jgi:hypothetical protein
MFFTSNSPFNRGSCILDEEISSRSKSRNLSAKSKAENKDDFSSVQLNNDISIKRGKKCRSRQWFCCFDLV